MRRISAILIAGLMLFSCRAQNVAPQDSPAMSGLERAAIEQGVVADTNRISPVGLFQSRNETGRDSLCVVPGQGREYRFGLEVQLGAEESCHGRGTARRTADKLVLNFTSGARCIVVAQYDGDRVAMPGVVDMRCADMCTGRGTIEGVDLPRLASDAGSASTVRDGKDALLCAQ